MSRSRFCPECGNVLHFREERGAGAGAGARSGPDPSASASIGSAGRERGVVALAAAGASASVTKTLVLACRMCGHTEHPKHPERPITSHDRQELAEADVSLSPELLRDPSLQRTRGRACPKCQHHELLVIGTSSKALGSLAIVFMCSNETCYHHFSDSPSIRIHCNIPSHTDHNRNAVRQLKYQHFGYSRPAEALTSQLTPTLWTQPTPLTRATPPTQPLPSQQSFTRPMPPPSFQRPRGTGLAGPAPPTPVDRAESKHSSSRDPLQPPGQGQGQELERGPASSPTWDPYTCSDLYPSQSQSQSPSSSQSFPCSQPRIYQDQSTDTKEPQDELDRLVALLPDPEPSHSPEWDMGMEMEMGPTHSGAHDNTYATTSHPNSEPAPITAIPAADGSNPGSSALEFSLTSPDGPERAFLDARQLIQRMSFDRQFGMTTLPTPATVTPESQQEQQQQESDPYAL